MKQLELPLGLSELVPVELRTVEAWADEKHTELHWLSGARHMNSWGLGREVSEDVFDAAIAAVQQITLR